MSYRLGLDLGANSLGWCLIRLDAEGRPCAVDDAGVRILTPNEEAGRDPQSKNSLAAGRRDARSLRRRRDRFLARQKALMRTLVAAGLMPKDEAGRKALERLDPYFLRAAALDGPLSLHEIGRAIFHLNQRRGFKSNRIADGDDSEAGAMKEGMAALKKALEGEGAKTLGEFLAKRHKRDKHGNRVDGMGRLVGKANGNGNGAAQANAEGVRFRAQAVGAKRIYDFFPTRDMAEDELRQIWAAQKKHHPQLTDKLLERLEYIIIAQRRLRKPLVGRCTFRPDEERAPRALPLFQRFRILSEIAALEIERPGRASRRLSMQERDSIANLLMMQTAMVPFDKMHRALKLPDDAHFNLERGQRKGLDADKTAAVLAKSGKGESFGKGWRGFQAARQAEIVERLLTEEDEDVLTGWLVEECSLSEAQAQAAGKARLPQGHGHIGRSMLTDLVDAMEHESVETADPETGEIYPRPLTYDEAVKAVDDRLHHSNFVPEKQTRLPYYGTAMARHVISNPAAPKGSQEFIGRVPNPTVHIALNQMRAVVNALIDAYGPPAEIRIELARELKQSRKQKDEATRKNRENERENIRRREELKDLHIADTYGSRLLLRLYDELPADHRLCVYCGKNIGSKGDLFASQVDIDHILPRSQTLDDGFANKVLCCLPCNREKGNRPPAEAWHGERLREIGERAERLFRHKAWRFAPDAMEKFNAQNDFIARHLTDSQHMARLAKDYLGHLYGEDRNKRVFASPGRLTSMLRGMWGLNDLMSDHNRLGEGEERVKNRDDHRHHAIDAFVIACTDLGLLNRVAKAAGRAEAHDLDRWAVKGEFPEPFAGYRDALRERLDAMVVSHKPDHGLSPGRRGSNSTSGKLHEETAYGAVDEQIDGKSFNLVTRKPIENLSDKEVGQVRDAHLREELEAVLYEAQRHGEKPADALKAYGEKHGIRRVRILKTEKYTTTIRHGGGRFAKTYVPGSNHRIELFATPDGKWQGEGVSVYDANQKGFRPVWRTAYPEAQLVMRLHKGDLFEADFGDGRQYYVVRQLSPANSRIEFVSYRFAGKAEGSTYIRAAFSKLQKAGARRVRVDPIGRVSPVEAKK